MSIQYCENCGKYIDLDKDVEHFERCVNKLKVKQKNDKKRSSRRTVQL